MSGTENTYTPTPKPSRLDKDRLKKLARKERMRSRAGRGPGERAGLRQLAAERYRAGILRVGKNSRKRINAILARYSLVGDPAVFDTDLFPFVKLLEQNWETIRAEAEAVLQARDALPALHEISPDHDRLSADDSWKAFFLQGYGIRCDRSAARCPRTSELLSAVPGLWSAFFSILGPGAHLPRHRGPTKAIVTWHLGLIIPRESERCWIQVADQRCLWEEGRSLIFDDARKHEVLNDSAEERVVLLVHLRRPMRFPGSLLGRLFLTAIKWSPFVRDAQKNQAAWEDAFEQALAERARTAASSSAPQALPPTPEAEAPAAPAGPPAH
jgi:beta-hydroxylase